MSEPIPVTQCPQCRTHVAPGLLVCPGCRALVYRDRLNTLAREAGAAEQRGDLPAALKLWREALHLLPSDSGQFLKIHQKIDALRPRVESIAGDEAAHARRIPKPLLALGAFGILIWKFKFILVFFLTKAKTLLFGLTKAQTFLTMFVSFGVYWAAWGWKFALGLILSIYVHEMGHIFALQRLGIKSSVPTFIPGLGALIRLKQYPASPSEDARVGLAGPLWGLFAALVCALVYQFTGWASWGAIARVGAWINLFNLLPFVPLDGGRGFRALSRTQKGAAASVIALMWVVSHEVLLVLLLLIAVFSAFQKSQAAKPDPRAFWEYCALVVALTLVTLLPVTVDG